MRNLPRIVANTKVGRNVIVKVWRNKKSITKKLVLGRLESSKEFIQENQKKKVSEEFEIESLKISVRNLNSKDIEERKLEKNLTGALVVEISSRSPLAFLLKPGDIIVELQNKSIKNVKDLQDISKKIVKDGEKTLLIRFINRNNQPSYGTVKIK